MKVSVVVVTYNHERFIDRALASVMSQETDFDFEVIVSEDASTDATRRIVLRWQERHPTRLKTILSERNLRTNEVVARGLRAASGEYVALLDGDDHWTSSRKLERQAAFLDENPDCALCFHNAEVIDESGNAIEGRRWTRDDRKSRSGLRDIWFGQHERLAFFGLLRCEDYAKRSVRPHERTLAGPKQDRLKILRATRANLSSVFLLYEDRDDRLPGLVGDALDADPLAVVHDASGASHALARIDEPGRVAALRDFLARRPLVIADGHHRYETALAYRDERRRSEPAAGPEAPFEFLLGCFANAYAPGSLLLPIHRLVRRGAPPDDATWAERLPGWSRRDVELPGPDAVPHLLEQHLAPLRSAHAFAADDASGRLRVFWRPRASDGDLDVRVIHREVIEGVFGLDEEAVREGAIDYPKDAVQTARDVRAGAGVVALYLNPLQPEDVFRVTEAGEVLPQKSTFFTPKLPTGLVFRLLEAGS